MTTNTQQALMEELWRKAGAMPKGIEIPCKTESAAARMRFALYNAVKKYRNGNRQADPALQRALNNCSISLGKQKTSVCILPSIMSEVSQAAYEVLGTTTVQTAEDIEAAESIERLSRVAEEVERPTEAKPHNPYPTRNRS